MINKEESKKIIATSFKFKFETKEMLRKISEKQQRKQITVLEMLIEKEAKREGIKALTP
jgi:hypothetical protein